MNVFTSGPRHNPWVWQVTALCFILGLLLAASLLTVSSIRRSGISGRVGMPPGGSPVRTDQLREREREITDLRRRNTELENTLAKGTGQAKTLNEELQKSKMLAGLTEVHGPGILLVLQDSKHRPPSSRAFDADKYIIHDVDLQQVVNELAASGAEAIAINTQRLIARTPIRCVGPTIQINGYPIVPPYEVRAIGDPATLQGGLNLPFGVLDGLRRYDPAMFRIERKPNMVLPAFAGSTEVRYSKMVVPKEGAETSKDGTETPKDGTETPREGSDAGKDGR